MSRTAVTTPHDYSTLADVEGKSNDFLGDFAGDVSWLVKEGCIYEVRLLHLEQGILSGYFNDARKIAEAIAPYNGRGNIFITPNPCSTNLASQADNKLHRSSKATADTDILRRDYLHIDIDSIHPADTPATDSEHEAAINMAVALVYYLADMGFPEQVVIDSGNGAYLLYAVELPNNDDSRDLLRRCLEALDARFSSREAKVDVHTYNASRLLRLPGTLNVKGTPTEERPHRPCRLRYLPKSLQTVDRSKLDELAAKAPTSKSSKRHGYTATVSTSNANAYARAALRDELNSVRNAPEGNRNNQLFRSAASLGEFVAGGALDEVEVERELHGAALSAGLRAGEIDGTISSGLRRGFNNPRQIPGQSIADSSPTNNISRTSSSVSSLSAEDAQDTQASAGEGKSESASWVTGPKPLRCTDAANAERFVAMFADDVRYVSDYGKWMYYDGTRWVIDREGQVVEKAKKVARAIYREAASADTDDAKRLAAWAGQSASKNRIDALLALAQSDPKVVASAGEFDTDKWLFNIQNGTLDLKTGELREHRREDFITKLAPVNYDPQATCPNFERFLSFIMSAPTAPTKTERSALVGFLQRALGMCLSGSIEERAFLVLYGTGRNGKSTLLATIQAMMGDYAQTAALDTFMSSKRSEATNDLAKLAGARFVSAVETGEGKKLNEVLVKQVTGGDRITTRFLYKEFFEFTPQFKLVMATNHRPSISGTDDGIWDRVKLVPFDVRIADADVDTKLPQKLLVELPGILNWAVQGCLMWQREGLGVPEEVVKATNSYRDEEDVLARFLAETCVIGEQYYVSVAALYAAYVRWCEDTGESACRQRIFATKLTERGFGESRRSHGKVRVRVGLGLQDNIHSA